MGAIRLEEDSYGEIYLGDAQRLGPKISQTK